ncbi:hypothetical protein SY83_20395 [Paenibacillus swuensis]|uniref:HAMP domain-containing protein n=1 Tax=Paenibacillus swuensis TaxID=1178515 RepID=A0A172TMK0_9BACL|nr:sensor histidine kinase [Paenibacillus swuensis]ANE48258.1 hypothetical protein SY83_20395 [Paenibacillus swuensis]
MLHPLKYPLNSIRNKLLFAFIALVIAPIFILFYSYYSSSQQLFVQTVNQSNDQVITRIGDSMNETAERMFKASNLIVNDPEVQQFLKLKENAWLEDHSAFQQYIGFNAKLNNILDFILQSRSYITVVDSRGHVFTSLNVGNPDQLLDDYSSQGWYAAALAGKGTPQWQLQDAHGINAAILANQEQLLVMSRQLKGDSVQPLGVMMIGIPLQHFLPDAKDIFLLKGSKVLFGDPLLAQQLRLDQLELGSDKDDQRPNKVLTQDNYLINHQTIQQLGWNFVQVMPQLEYTQGLRYLRNQSFIWLSLFFLGSCALFVVFMFRFIQPIKRLLSSMVKVGDGNFNEKIEIKGSDEIALLSHNFNSMVHKLRKLIVNLSEEQQRKEEARFHALQSQISPHFLFNTLNSIKWSARMSGAEHVSRMITSLGKMLTFVMSHDREMIALREELDFLEQYIKLQNIRFNNHLSLVIEVPESLLKAHILKLSLQPLVENSLIHGNRSQIEVVIRAEMLDGDLHIYVNDNGVGFAERAEQMEVPPNPLIQAKFSGIGLRNIHERIHMHFGEGYGLEQLQSLTGGASVKLSMPWLEGDKQNDPHINRRR